MSKKLNPFAASVFLLLRLCEEKAFHAKAQKQKNQRRKGVE
jgi:hypothetical protein